MLRVTAFREAELERLIAQARGIGPSSPSLLTLSGAHSASGNAGFAHDLTRSLLGTGEADFNAACEALAGWKNFDLGWVRVANPAAEIRIGQVVAVLAQTFGVWSANLSVITDVVRSATLFGFVYTTTTIHMEEGQERFVLELQQDGSVLYTIEAWSRPRHLLARLGYPVARAMQSRFARGSHSRMWRAVGERGIEIPC